VLEGFYVRVIASGLYGHVTFTGIACIGFAYFVTRRGGQPFIRRLLVAAALLLLAMAAHFVWNSPLLATLPILLYGIVKGLPFLIGLIVLVILARRREHQSLGDLLALEIGRAGMTAGEIALLGNRHARREMNGLVSRNGGGDGKRALRRLQREDVNLALVASTVDSVDDARVVAQRERSRGIRAMLVGLPGVAQALGMSTSDMAEAQASMQRPFQADYLVGARGGWAWTVPDQSAPRVPLAVNLALQAIETRGDWLLVRTSGGWYGWTGLPYLVAPGLDPAALSPLGGGPTPQP
jgi:hypothetical protein